MESPSIALENVGLSDFLRVIFNAKPENERVFANITETRAPSDSDPRKFWSGRSESEVERFGKWHAGNTYYCVATVEPDANGVARRAMSHFGGLYVLVLDDVRDLTPFFELDPTYVLETSPGNYQVGFKFTQPIRNLAVAKALTKSLSDQGFAGNDPSGNSAVRWARAPGGRNWKYNPPFTHRLIVWQPDMLFEPENLAAFLKLSLDPIKEDIKPSAPVTGDSIAEGGRNQALTSMAGSMRRRGMGEESIYAALSVENAAKCIPPLPDADIATIARSVARYEPSEVFRATVGGEVDAAGKLRPIGGLPFNIAESMAIEPRDFLNGAMFTRKKVTGTFGAGASAKSQITNVDALEMVTGIRLNTGKPTKRGKLRVWLINVEDDIDEVLRRLAGICKHYALRQEDIEDRLIIDNDRDGRYVIAETTRDGLVVRNVVVDAMVDFALTHKVDVIIVDPLVHLHAVSENDNAGMGAVIGKLRHIADKANVALHIIHHMRKQGAMATSELTIDDGRGAGSVASAMRAARLIRRMSKSEAADWGILEADRFRYIRVDLNGKPNMTAGDSADRWYRLESVGLDNARPDGRDQDEIGAPVRWYPPKPTDGLDSGAFERVLAALSAADPLSKARNSKASTGWFGHLVGETLDIDSTSDAGKKQVDGIIAQMVGSGQVERFDCPDSKRRLRTCYRVKPTGAKEGDFGENEEF